MCGIFGYLGEKKTAGKIVLEGLKKLEYRGYDSWGIALIPRSESDKFFLTKDIGKISKVRLRFPPSCQALGHTRWATHGGVSKINAHPHLDCSGKLALVHNGIIENYEELKIRLEKKGHHFRSSTDTETLVHLLEEYLKTTDFQQAFRRSFREIKGLNAVIALDLTGKSAAAAKTGSSLAVGLGEDGYYLTSDPNGITGLVSSVIYLEDRQVLYLDKELFLTDLEQGNRLRPDYKTLKKAAGPAGKGKYKHFFLKEICEQPAVIRKIVKTGKPEAVLLAELISRSRGSFFVGCGSASYAAKAGVYLFSKIANLHLNDSIGSEFKYLQNYLTDRSLVIAISQSGETIDVIEPVSEAKKYRAKIAALTNVENSSLYRLADHRFRLQAGPEQAVIASKSFSAMISFLLLTAHIAAGKLALGQRMLLDTAGELDKIINRHSGRIRKLAADLSQTEHIYVIGRGLSYPLALEGALKLKETACAHAEGFAGGELKHGVIALIEKNTPVIVLVSKDETLPDILSNAQEIKSRGGRIIGISPENNPVFDEYLAVGDTSEATVISQSAVMQLLAYYLALEKGISDPDKPRNLAKSVTVK